MANKQRGEVSMEVLGKSYTLVLSLNAMCDLEDLLSTPESPVTFHQALGMVMRNSVRHVRAFLWACLRSYHAEMTLKDAGQLIEDAGGLAGFATKLAALAAAAFPDAEDAKVIEKEIAARPPRAQRLRRVGTGAS